MDPSPIIRTERLTLRPYHHGDAGAIFESYATDPEVCRYLEWRPHQALSETESFVQERVRAWDSGKLLTWAMIAENDELIGSIDLKLNGHKATVGYVLARPYWGKGLAAEALRGVLDYGFEHLGLHRIWATCDLANLASARVMEKAGMRKEGILRSWTLHPSISDEPRDAFCYASVSAAECTESSPPPLPEVSAKGLQSLTETLNALHLEGRRTAGFEAENHPDSERENEWVAWISSYRNRIQEALPIILGIEHPLRLQGHHNSIAQLWNIVHILEKHASTLDGLDDLSPSDLASEVADTFNRIHEISAQIYDEIRRN